MHDYTHFNMWMTNSSDFNPTDNYIRIDVERDTNHRLGNIKEMLNTTIKVTMTNLYNTKTIDLVIKLLRRTL